MRGIILTLCFILPATALSAQRAYVTDQQDVQLRAGQSSQHKALQSLPAGTPVTVVRVDPSSGYTQVVLESGARGWILSRHLMSQPAARAQLEDAKAALAAMTEENKALRDELAAFRTDHSGAEKTLRDVTAERDRLHTDVIAIRQAAANTLQIQAERDRLQVQVIELERELEILRRQNHALESDHRQGWFLIGASVLLGGFLLGLVAPRLSLRRRRGWDTF